MSHIVYDFAIVGAGAAGLHLALAMSEDDYFADKKIALLEKDQKNENDRTWCFWEKGRGKWDDITTKIWNKAQFANSKKVLHLDMGAYRYKMISAIDFYNHAKSKLAARDNIHWITDEIEHVEVGPVSVLHGKETHYQSRQVFDSRIDKDFYKDDDQYIRLLQHFKGWVIETDQPVFDPESFMMMDFRLKWPETTSFTYILPFSETRALVEFTFFSPELIADNEYEKYLDKYIREILKIEKFSIVSEEKGIIPMSNYPFHKSNTEYLTKIGTAGSWVKPSSGYSFKNAERYSILMIRNIKSGLTPSLDLFNNRFRKYDALFLDVLWNYNELGEQIFSDMYSKNNTELILRFLDEETNLLEEVKIISSFQKMPFIKALLRSFY